MSISGTYQGNFPNPQQILGGIDKVDKALEELKGILEASEENKYVFAEINGKEVKFQYKESLISLAIAFIGVLFSGKKIKVGDEARTYLLVNMVDEFNKLNETLGTFNQSPINKHIEKYGELINNATMKGITDKANSIFTTYQKFIKSNQGLIKSYEKVAMSWQETRNKIEVTINFLKEVKKQVFDLGNNNLEEKTIEDLFKDFEGKIKVLNPLGEELKVEANKFENKLEDLRKIINNFENNLKIQLVAKFNSMANNLKEQINQDQTERSDSEKIEFFRELTTSYHKFKRNIEDQTSFLEEDQISIMKHAIEEIREGLNTKLKEFEETLSQKQSHQESLIRKAEENQQQIIDNKTNKESKLVTDQIQLITGLHLLGSKDPTIEQGIQVLKTAMEYEMMTSKENEHGKKLRTKLDKLAQELELPTFDEPTFYPQLQEKLNKIIGNLKEDITYKNLQQNIKDYEQKLTPRTSFKELGETKKAWVNALKFFIDRELRKKELNNEERQTLTSLLEDLEKLKNAKAQDFASLATLDTIINQLFNMATIKDRAEGIDEGQVGQKMMENIYKVLHQYQPREIQNKMSQKIQSRQGYYEVLKDYASYTSKTLPEEVRKEEAIKDDSEIYKKTAEKLTQELQGHTIIKPIMAFHKKEVANNLPTIQEVESYKKSTTNLGTQAFADLLIDELRQLERRKQYETNLVSLQKWEDTELNLNRGKQALNNFMTIESLNEDTSHLESEKAQLKQEKEQLEEKISEITLLKENINQ